MVARMPWWRSTGAALASTLASPSSKVSASCGLPGSAITSAGVAKLQPSSTAICRCRSKSRGPTSLTPHSGVPTEW